MDYTQIPTYSLTDNTVVHTGYFILSPGHRLRHTLRGPWDKITASPRFPLDGARIINGLQLAQK